MTAIEKTLGVTRVARVTGLDRAGVEVACAVRPGGHVLQVSNGKGVSWEQARASALAEAAELWAAERPHGLCWDFSGERWDLRSGRLAQARCAWVRSDEGIFVPAHAVYCPPPGSASMGPAAVRWSSNGMGAAVAHAAAVRHAVLEALERDQLARALPEGWTRAALRSRRVQPPRALQPLVDSLRAVELEPYLFDLRADLGVPVAGAILADAAGGPVPVTAGYACRLNAVDALQAALLEAAQSRLTEVHGAREDVSHSHSHGLAEECAAAPAQRVDMPRFRAPPLGPHRVAVVTLARAPLYVVKVVSPALRVSELL